MVKGITRQVVVVNGPDPKLFDQAIFLIRDEALAEGGITEEALLKEARLVCRRSRVSPDWLSKALWAGCGAGTTGLLWLLCTLL